MVRRSKNVKKAKKWIKHVKYIISMPINIVFTNLLWSQKICPVYPFFQFYMFICEHAALNHFLGIYKWLFQHQEAIFGEFDLPLWKFLWSGLCLAFLALMASKIKMVLKPDLLLPNDLRNVKKLSSVAFVMAFKILFAFL